MTKFDNHTKSLHCDMDETRIRFFDRKTIQNLVWLSKADGLDTKSFFTPLIENGIEHYVDNMRADVEMLQIDQFVIPLVIADKNYNNSFVCSPYGQYISYAKESVQLIGNQFLEFFIRQFLSGLGVFFRLGAINSVVYVNHSLFTTDLYPSEINEEQISLVVRGIKKRFPRHAIILRSINPITNSSMMGWLEQQGFHLIASRHIYITNPENTSMFQTRTLKRDLKLWKEHRFEILDTDKISHHDYADLLNLYNSLFLDQHSYLNPQYNYRFIKMLLEQRLINFIVLKMDGKVKGVAGYFDSAGIMVCPIFGYDKTDPQNGDIYRVLNTALLLEAKKRGVIFNQGSGASSYKLNRQAEGCLDFIAVYTDHLPRKQKLVWSALKNFINTFAPRYMKKY